MESTELNFLTYRLSIDSHITSALLTSEVFYRYFKEIKDQGKRLDDQTVYKGLEELLFPILHEESEFLYSRDFKDEYTRNHSDEEYKIRRKNRRLFLRAITRLSQVLYGDADYWKYDYEGIYGTPYSNPIPNNKVVKIEENDLDLQYLIEICDELSAKSINSLFAIPELKRKLRERQVNNLQEIYDICCEVFSQFDDEGYQDSNDRKKRDRYYRLRHLIRDLCEVIFGDRNYNERGV